MRHLTPEEIRQAVRGRWRWPARSVTVEGICIDSRTARPGDLFVALRGRRFDGHDFLPQAAAAGCIAAVVDARAPLTDDVLRHFGGGAIGVADTTTALGDMAAHCRKHLPAAVVAVTGSNGKTTVKRMVHHILSRRLRGSAGPSSFNNAIGVPLTLLAAGSDDDYVVCEIGSSARGEIGVLSQMARPDVAVIVSVGATHLAGLTDLEHVAMEKAAVLGGLSDHGVAIVCADSDHLARAVRGYDVRLMIRFGQADSAHLRLTGYEPRPGGGRFQLNGRLWAELPVPGRHNATNALAAIAVAQRLGFDQDEAAAALADYVGAEMRMQPVRFGGVTIINDAYNANPASLAAAAEGMASFAGKRRVAVIGDMLELGAESVSLHQAAGADLARQGFALVVGVGELGRYIADGAEAAGTSAERIGSVDRARRRLGKMLRRGDVVLVKGSRAVGMERLVEPIRKAMAGSGKSPSATRTRRPAKKQRRRTC